MVNLLQYSGVTKHLRISQNLLLFLRKKRERDAFFVEQACQVRFLCKLYL